MVRSGKGVSWCILCGSLLLTSVFRFDRHFCEMNQSREGLEPCLIDRHCLCRTVPVDRRPVMTQTNNRFFDEIGRLMNDAAGAAQGVKREVDTLVRNQAEKILRDLDVVKREEFEAVKARIAALEAKPGATS